MTEQARPAPSKGIQGIRLALGLVGVLAIIYGGMRIFTDAKDTKPLALGKWLIGSLLVHDLIIAPVVIGLGWVLNRIVPDRARKYLQAGLICGGLVSAVGVFMIYRRGKTSSPALALLQQNYKANLLLLLALIAIVCGAGYVIEVVRTNRTKTRPPADQ